MQQQFLFTLPLMMRSPIETVIFWILWAVASGWALRTFFFSYAEEKLQRLRRTAFLVDLSVLTLFLLPWTPASQGALSGRDILLSGRADIALLFLLLLISTLIFALGRSGGTMKLGAVCHMAASVLLIAVMIRLMPGTFVLTWHSIAPIIASLMLLAGNVVVLLLWQQIALREVRS